MSGGFGYLLRRDLPTALIAVLALTVVFGLAYPLAITGIAQVAFPGQANGSKVSFDGKTVGSKLIGAQRAVTLTAPPRRWAQVIP